MVNDKMKQQISKDFDFLKSHLKGIILFGSYAENSSTPRSDIDICLVAGKSDVKEIFNNDETELSYYFYKNRRLIDDQLFARAFTIRSR